MSVTSARAVLSSVLSSEIVSRDNVRRGASGSAGMVPVVSKRVVEIPVDEESLAVTYDRDAYIRASAEVAPFVLLATGNRFSTRYAESSSTVDMLVKAIVSWNLIDDDGGAHPITRESLSHLPLYLLYKIAQAIGADVVASDQARE